MFSPSTKHSQTNERIYVHTGNPRQSELNMLYLKLKPLSSRRWWPAEAASSFLHLCTSSEKAGGCGGWEARDNICRDEEGLWRRLELFFSSTRVCPRVLSSACVNHCSPTLLFAFRKCGSCFTFEILNRDTQLDMFTHFRTVCNYFLNNLHSYFVSVDWRFFVIKVSTRIWSRKNAVLFRKCSVTSRGVNPLFTCLLQQNNTLNSKSFDSRAFVTSRVLNLLWPKFKALGPWSKWTAET